MTGVLNIGDVRTPEVTRGALREFWRVFASAWVCARRPAFLVPGFAATALFAVIMVVGIFLSAARPGGSRIQDEPLFLADLADPTALSNLAGGMVSIVGACVLAVAAAHMAAPFTNGSIRIQLVRQPRRRIWAAGNLAVVVVLSIVLTLVSVLAVVLSAFVMAPMYDVATTQWLSADGLSALAATTLNLTGSMVGFGVMGAVMAVALRSAIAAIGVGLCYALFEELLAGVFPDAARFFPAQNIAALSVGGKEHIPYAWAIVGSIVVIAAAVAITLELVRRRDVLD